MFFLDMAVQQLLSFIEGAREVVETMMALWVLRGFTYLSSTACMQVVELSGVNILGKWHTAHAEL